MQIGKSTISYRRSDDPQQDRSLALAVKKLAWAHKFSTAGQTDIDLTALTAPTLELPSWVNPSASALAGANLVVMPENLRLVSSAKGVLSPLAYTVISNTKIRLSAGAESLVDEIIFGWVESTNTRGVIAVDGRAICQTGTLTAGSSDIVVGDPFTYNKYSSQQAGDVLLFIDGVLQARCVGNVVGGDGNYYEVQPSSGSLSNTLRLKTTFGSDVAYMVVSNGYVAERPTAAVMAKFESMSGTIDQVVQDLAVVTGLPTSRYQAAPSSVDLAAFGNKVSAIIDGCVYDAVVGSSAQLASGIAHFTSVQAAVDAASTGDRILVLQGTYAENVTIDKKLFVEGKGHGSYLNGTLSLGPNSDYSMVKWVRFGGNVTLQVGADGIFFRECWMVSGKAVTNSGAGNSVLVIQE